MREAGLVFALPTYGFIVVLYATIGVGAFHRATGGCDRATVSRPLSSAGPAVGVFVIPKAFGSGSSALIVAFHANVDSLTRKMARRLAAGISAVEAARHVTRVQRRRAAHRDAAAGGGARRGCARSSGAFRAARPTFVTAVLPRSTTCARSTSRRTATSDLTAGGETLAHVVTPGLVLTGWRKLLHDQRALYVKRLLRFESRLIVTSVPYQLARPASDAALAAGCRCILPTVARKLPGLQRVLDAPTLGSVAYGEIASSIYFALGVIALHALGLTPAVLLAVGALFLCVSLSYAEGTAAIPETGGAATFVRRAFNDLVGFMTGWALFLDYLIVIALSALFIPHYLAGAFQVDALDGHPWDVLVGVGVIVAIAVARLVRRAGIYRMALVVAVLDLVTQVLLVALGFAFLFSGGALRRGIDLGTTPSWHAIAFALPLAMLAYTGLETLANLAEEAREPGKDLPRSLFTAIGLVVVIYVLIAVVGLSAFPVRGGHTALGDKWLHAPLQGIVDALRTHLPGWAASTLRVYVGVSGALILLTAATTSISGFSRLAFSLGEHGQLPRTFGRLNRRTLVSPEAIVAAAVISSLLLLGTWPVADDVGSLAALFSFGVLLAFTAAQLAVIRLRFTEPALARPYRTPLPVRIRGVEVPLPAIVGALLTFAIWVAAMVTHPGARYAGPAWLALGVVVYVLVRRGRGEGVLEHVEAPPEVLPEAKFSRILVPMKLGVIGEEMVATAVRLAQESGATVEALYVIRVPLELALDAELVDQEERAAASLAEARLLGAEHGVEVDGVTVRARAIGEAIVEEAAARGVDLIVLGSAPRWRRQSRFFSPTVEYVLRKAPCEVLIVAFPQAVYEAERAAT